MSNFIESRPQELCLMCGKCCRCVTTAYSYEELIELAKSNDEGAKDFLSIFVPYTSVEDARKVHEEVVDNILNILKADEKPTDNLTFYKCKHLSDNNLCEIYEKRLMLCDRFPSSTWAVVPPGCGFENWLVKKREEIVQNVRNQKKCLIEYESALETANCVEDIERLKNAIKKIRETIVFYSKYGAQDW